MLDQFSTLTHHEITNGECLIMDVTWRCGRCDRILYFLRFFSVNILLAAPSIIKQVFHCLSPEVIEAYRSWYS
jgi:hypothetical protein